MPNKNSENKIIAEAEIGNDGVGHSTMHGESAGGSNEPSAEELKLALVASQETINAMSEELKRLRSEQKPADSSSSDIHSLVEMLANAIVTNKAQKGPTLPDNLNRAEDFKERTRVDGQSLMEAQATMSMYKNEPKVWISIPKSFQGTFGPALSVTVNGVRVAVPVDGKQYLINETHAIHVRERMAKVDRLNADSEPQVVEINA